MLGEACRDRVFFDREADIRAYRAGRYWRPDVMAFDDMNVKTLCLGILSFSDMTGYDIRKLASEGNFCHFCEAGYGSIYPALSQLTRAGLVTRREERCAGKPQRKIYSLTSRGREALMATLEDAPGPDKFKSEFLFYGLFADKMPAAQFDALLERKIASVGEALEKLEGAAERCEHEPSRFALGYGVAMNRAVLDYLSNYRDKRRSDERGAAKGETVSMELANDR